MKAKLFYAVGPNCWGIGPTKGQAISKAKQNWPSFVKPRSPKPRHFSVWATDAPEILRVCELDGSFSVAKGYEVIKVQTSSLAKTK